MEPPIAEDFGCLLGAIPVAGEHVRSSDDDLAIFSRPHLNARDRGPDMPGHRVLGIVHSADSCRLGETIAERYRKRADELLSKAEQLTERAHRYSRMAEEMERGAPPIVPEQEHPTSGDQVLALLTGDDLL